MESPFSEGRRLWMHRVMHAGARASLGVFTSVMTIVIGCDSGQCSLLARQILQEPHLPNIVRPDALLHRYKDLHRGLANRIIGALQELFHHIVDRGGPSAPFLHVPGARADDDQLTMAVKRPRSPDRRDQYHHRRGRHPHHSTHRLQPPRVRR
jgi:hypothetical protein